MFQSVARNGFNTSEGVAAQVLRRYGMALLVVLAAGLLRWSLRPALGTDSPFMTFYVAVVIAAVLGWGPGLFSTALGAVLGLWLTGGWLRATEDPLELLFFLVSGLGVSAVAGRMRRGRRQGEKALKRAGDTLERMRDVAQRYRQLLRSATDYGIIFLDLKGVITDWSPGAESVFGLKVEEAVGKPIHLIFTQADCAQKVPEREMEQALQGSSAADERWHVRADGGQFYASGVLRALRDRAGRPTGFVKILRDRTAHKRVEDELDQTAHRFQLAQAAAQVGVFDWNMQTGEAFWSSELEEIYGLPAGEFEGRYEYWAKRVHPDDLRELEKVFADWRQSNETERQLEYRYFRNGQEHWMLARACVLRDADGRAIRMVGTNQDITDRKQAEMALRESESRLRLFIEYAPAGLAMFDPQMRYLAATRRWAEDYGLKGQFIGRSHYELFPDLPERWKGIHQRGLAGEVLRADDDPFPRQDGTMQWVDWEVRPWHTVEGKVGGLLIAAEDVSQRVRMQQALRESEERFRVLFEAQPLSTFLVEPGTLRIEDCNEQAAETLGYPREKLCHMRVVDIDAQLSAETIEDYLARTVRDGKNVVIETRFRTRPGEVREMIVTSCAIRIHGRDLAYATALDVTERNRSASAVRQARDALERANAELEQRVEERTAKLRETIGEMEHFSYTITHDMRAPLRAMEAFGSILRQQYSAQLDQAGQDFIRRIMESAKRMDALITDALSYSKVVREQMTLEPVNPENLLRAMVESYPEYQLPKVVVKIKGPIPPVVANQAGLTQCFSNLLSNAVKFVQPGKVPEVRIWAETVAGAAAGELNRKLVRICFEDNGIGIPQDQLEKIFIMFQRATHGYEGTGIGLALVKKVVERMKGSVKVESQEGQGSRFWIELPLAEV